MAGDENVRICNAIRSLRTAMRTELSERRKPTDRGSRRAHQRIDTLKRKIEPLTLANAGRRALATVGAWTIATLVAVGSQLVTDFAGPPVGTVIEVIDTGIATYDMTIENAAANIRPFSGWLTTGVTFGI